MPCIRIQELQEEQIVYLRVQPGVHVTIQIQGILLKVWGLMWAPWIFEVQLTVGDILWTIVWFC